MTIPYTGIYDSCDEQFLVLEPGETVTEEDFF